MRLILALIFFFSSFSAFTQTHKSLRASRTEQAPKTDGILDDEAWKTAEAARDFIQFAPYPGKPAGQRSEVKIVYDNTSIYVGAMLYDEHPDSILSELTTRDNEVNADMFGVILDTYNDDINAYGFFVSAAGVQIDTRYSSNGQDFYWDAVWYSAVRITEKGWVVEFRIPYSALRFPGTAEQNWGMNIMRKIRRTREDNFWSEYRTSQAGLVNQFGDLTGISNIKSPLRLSLSPYISGYVENFPYDEPGKSNNSYFVNGGMDIKYGINESFTLDMTLVPDFGQVQSDNVVLNLSPFEVRYDENRSFFTEGTELFNKSGFLFYSRRVGGMPVNYFKPYEEASEDEIVVENPSSAQLYNATKISGRTKGRLGIGVFNATTAPVYAKLEDISGNTRIIETQPLSNYSVIVLDQVLKNNSYLSFINTNVTRNGSEYDANVTGTQFKIVNKKNTYAVNGDASLTQLYYADSTPVLGYGYYVEGGKISGKIQYNVSATVKSDKYDPNDLGIMGINNTLEFFANASYNIFEPVWKIRDFSASIGTGYSRLYKPGFLWNYNIYGEAYTTFLKSFLSTGAGFNFEPIITYDHWEPRVKGYYYTYPKDYMGYYWFSSDYRKRFALDGGINYKYFAENNRYSFFFNLAPRFRVSNKLSFVYRFDRQYFNDDIGFVNFNEAENRITFGRRNVQTLINMLNASYIFTNKMALTLRVRHYWSKAEYLQYYTLSDKGLLFDDSQYAGNSNVNFNAFNIDMVYRWRFSPGSEMSFVWKNAIYTRGSAIVRHFRDDIDETFNSPATNSFSIKVLYYLDYSMLNRKNKSDRQ
jgi:hypothetical protein